MTFILEDVATSIAAILASQATLSAELALGSLLTGIIIGDLGLYGIGRWAGGSKLVKRWTTRKGGTLIESILSSNIPLTVLLARCVPGMRLPTYSSMGLFHVNFRIFAITVCCAVGVWSTALFFIIFYLGQSIEAIAGTHYWLWLAAIMMLPFILTRGIKWYMNDISCRKESEKSS